MQYGFFASLLFVLGRAKTFLDSFATGGRIQASFLTSPAVEQTAMRKDSECFSSLLLSPTDFIIQQSNMFKKRRNIKIGMTYLLLIAIRSPFGGAGSSTAVPLVESSDDNDESKADKLHYALLAPPLAFHKRFRHSIYNVICTDCGKLLFKSVASSCKKPGITNKFNYELLLFLANAPLIKQLNVRYNASTDVVTAYCASQGHPIPSFSWLLDGVSVSSLDDDNADFESTLRVERIRSSRLVYLLISYHPPHHSSPLFLQLEILLNQCMYPRAIFDE